MPQFRKQSPKHNERRQGILAPFSLLLILPLVLSACSTTRGQFDDQGSLDYGDLHVSILETGYDRSYAGFICDDPNYGHPYVTLTLTCRDDATTDCKARITLATKFDNGSSWGKDNFSTSDSPTEFASQFPFLRPGETEEITFRPNSATRHCWSINQDIKKITVILRDRSGELKDMKVTYKPE
jgi:hypothetical protein